MTESGNILERLASLPTFSHPTVSEDGEKLAVYYDITRRNEIHVMDIETRETEQWSDGQVPRSPSGGLVWGTEDNRVLFHLDEGGNQDYDIYSVDSDGNVESVVEMEGRTEIRDIDRSNRRLLLGSGPDGISDLYIHDLSEPNNDPTKITDYESYVGHGKFSPDSNRIVYCANETANPENTDTYVAEDDGSNPRKLDMGETGASSVPADWHPNGDKILVSDDSKEFRRPGIYDLENDTVTWFGGLEYQEVPRFFTPAGDRFVVSRVSNVTAVPVVYDVKSGESHEFDVPEGVTAGVVYGDIDVVDDNRVVVTHTTPTKRRELLIYDIERDEYGVLLESDNFSRSDFVDAQHFTFDSDGVPETTHHALTHDPYKELEIDALLYDSGERPSPLVVNPHGGPYSRDSLSFDLRTQFLVSEGYSVLKVNYRGSYGRGTSFREELYGDWGGGEQGDIATGVEHVLEEHDWVDEDRIAVFGGSYGGYSAYWQMLQYPELYDAGIAWIGQTHLKKQYEDATLFRAHLEKYLGTPDENPELYENRSPITHVENLDAPLLIVHGVNDPNVPVTQARLFRDALNERGFEEGTDFEYVELTNEGHGSGDIDQKIRFFRILSDFLDRRLD